MPSPPAPYQPSPDQPKLTLNVWSAYPPAQPLSLDKQPPPTG